MANRHKHVADLTPEELELRHAKQNAWYHSRSPEYKAELLRKQREYGARKRAEAKAKGERIRSTWKMTQEQKDLKNKQNALSRQARIEKRQQELEEQGLTGFQVCSVCTKAKPIKNFIGTKNPTKPCKICNECRARIYATGIHDDGKLDAKFWDRKSKRLNQMILQQLRKEQDKPEMTMFDMQEYASAADLIRLYNEQGHRCYYCGVELDDTLSVDHKLPRSKGGGNSIANLCITCPDCNRLKWTRTEEEFLVFLTSYVDRVVAKFADKEPQVTNNQVVTHSSKALSLSEPSSQAGPLSIMDTAIDCSISSMPEVVDAKEGELLEASAGDAGGNQQPSSEQLEFDF